MIGLLLPGISGSSAKVADIQNGQIPNFHMINEVAGNPKLNVEI